MPPMPGDLDQDAPRPSVAEARAIASADAGCARGAAASRCVSASYLGACNVGRCAGCAVSNSHISLPRRRSLRSRASTARGSGSSPTVTTTTARRRQRTAAPGRKGSRSGGGARRSQRRKAGPRRTPPAAGMTTTRRAGSTSAAAPPPPPPRRGPPWARRAAPRPAGARPTMWPRLSRRCHPFGRPSQAR